MRKPMITFLYITGMSIIFMSGCDGSSDVPISHTSSIDNSSASESMEVPESEFKLDNEDPRYLFDTSVHSLDDLINLLKRAEDLYTARRDTYDDLDIVLMLHGPDINLFRKQNYQKNRELVDLAARLDAFRVIDMKICETTMSDLGVNRNEIPPFIESVPYAPKEIKRLTEEGYYNL